MPPFPFVRSTEYKDSNLFSAHIPTMRFFSDQLGDRKSSASIQVIGAGLPRCATSSLKKALESPSIGFSPCMHMEYVMPYPDRGELVVQAMKETDTARRHKILVKLFSGFEATTDFPGCIFVADLMDMYPDAKIIMNKRPGGSKEWERSISVLLWAGSLSHYAVAFLWRGNRIIHALWTGFEDWAITTLGLTRDELMTAKMHDAHVRWVHAEAAKRGREVLDFEPSDGWGPLCQFLGKTPPKDEPFPHANEAAETRFVARIMYTRGALSWLALGGAVYGGVRCVRWLLL